MQLKKWESPDGGAGTADEFVSTWVGLFGWDFGKSGEDKLSSLPPELALRDFGDVYIAAPFLSAVV
jgi:hypothetical protein